MSFPFPTCFDKVQEGEQALTHSRGGREYQRTDASALDLSIVIISFNTRELTRKCIRSIEEHASGISHEVFVVDNASSDGSANMVAEAFPWVHLIRLDENRGFAGGNIPGMLKAKGDYILLLNSDAFISENVLADTIGYMNANRNAGILGCKLIGEDGSMQPSARMLPCALSKILHVTGLAGKFPKSRFFGQVDLTWWNHSEPRKVGWVVGAFFLIRRKTMEAIGVLDDRYFLYFEEIDYCLAAQKSGWDVVFYPYAEVVHIGGQSAAKSGERLSTRGMQLLVIRLKSEYRYYRKFYGRMMVLLIAAIEFSWNIVIYVRNCLRLSRHGSCRRKEALSIIGLILSTLYKDRLGYGEKKKPACCNISGKI